MALRQEALPSVLVFGCSLLSAVAFGLLPLPVDLVSGSLWYLANIAVILGVVIVGGAVILAFLRCGKLGRPLVRFGNICRRWLAKRGYRVPLVVVVVLLCCVALALVPAIAYFRTQNRLMRDIDDIMCKGKPVDRARVIQKLDELTAGGLPTAGFAGAAGLVAAALFVCGLMFEGRSDDGLRRTSPDACAPAPQKGQD